MSLLSFTKCFIGVGGEQAAPGIPNPGSCGWSSRPEMKLPALGTASPEYRCNTKAKARQLFPEHLGNVR